MMPAIKAPQKRAPYTPTNLLQDYLDDNLPLAKSTEHFEYSSVFLTQYPPMTLFLLTSENPIDFAEMPKYISQIEAFDAIAEESGIHQTDDSSPMWLYHNDANQPLHPGGNPVRSPFLFEIGYPIEPFSHPVEKPSPEAGTFVVKELRALSVASIVYKGSFPHQENSGFVEACQTILPAIRLAGLECAYTRYREIGHLIDWDNPTQSGSEIQVEVRGVQSA